MPSTAPSSPSPSSPSSSTILSPSANLTLSSDLSTAKPQHIYNLSSQYFLTKHFPEANQSIKPLLQNADRKWQYKAWGLYLIILDNGLKLSDDQGHKVWGRQIWEQELARVKGYQLWIELLDAFRGSKASISAEIMLAMIQVSLHHGDPKIGQLKVEEWLAAVPPPYPKQSTSDMDSLTNGEANGNGKGRDYYGKVLELYILSLLPRNEEWEFADTFIGMNEYLSESKKKAYIAKLGDLKLAHEKEKAKPPPKQPTKSSISTKSSPKVRQHSPSTSTSSKDDLSDLPHSPTTTPLPATNTASGPTQHTLSTLATRLLRNPARYFRHFLTLIQDLSHDDSFLRTLLFALALIMALVRRDVRARLRIAFAWVSRKVRETIVMGGKVGYLVLFGANGWRELALGTLLLSKFGDCIVDEDMDLESQDIVKGMNMA